MTCPRSKCLTRSILQPQDCPFLSLLLTSCQYHLLLTYTVLPLGKTTTLEAGLAGLGDFTVATLPLGTGVDVGVEVVLVQEQQTTTEEEKRHLPYNRGAEFRYSIAILTTETEAKDFLGHYPHLCLCNPVTGSIAQLNFSMALELRALKGNMEV